MNECLTTPQHEKQIGYWVSEKGITIQKNMLRLNSDKAKERRTTWDQEGMGSNPIFFVLLIIKYKN